MADICEKSRNGYTYIHKDGRISWHRISNLKIRERFKSDLTKRNVTNLFEKRVSVVPAKHFAFPQSYSGFARDFGNVQLVNMLRRYHHPNFDQTCVVGNDCVHFL